MPGIRTRRSAATLSTTSSVFVLRAGTGIRRTIAADVAATTDPGTTSEAASTRCVGVVANGASRMASRKTTMRAPESRRRASAFRSTPHCRAWSTVITPSCLAAMWRICASIAKVDWAWRIVASAYWVWVLTRGKRQEHCGGRGVTLCLDTTSGLCSVVPRALRPSGRGRSARGGKGRPYD